MPKRLLRVALTGGIATGKSYCLRRLAALGAHTIDADTLARQAVAPGSAGLAAVRARFGDVVFSAEGTLDRAALGRIVFSDRDARLALEAIVHPAVFVALTRWFESEAGIAAGLDVPTIAVADIPLLFEAGRPADYDRVIVAACSAQQQRERLMARDGITAADADRRVAAQMSLDEKRRRADYVIDTSGSLEQTDRDVERVWSRLQTDAEYRADRRS